MKKNLALATLIVSISGFTLFSYSPVQAKTVTKDDIQLRDKLIVILLYPLIQQELRKQNGEIKQNDCANIIQNKKLPQGSFLFNVTVQVTTFEGAYNPPYDIVTITFSNEKTLE